MTKNATRIVATREYLKVVRKKSFWLMVLLLPIFYIAVSVISGMSGESVQKKITEQAKAAARIIIVDQGNFISDANIVKPIERSNDAASASQAVRAGQADAAFIYPADLNTSFKIIAYIKDDGIIARGRFDQLAVNLIKQSILEKVGNPEQIALYNAPLTLNKTVYADGKAIVTSIEAFILPILAVVVFFLLTITSSSYMLMSVSEEKENRMIETILSIVTPRQLIWGKLIAMVGLAFTQLIVLAAFGVVAYQVSTNVLPIDINWSLVHLDAWQVLLTAFFISAGFVFMASLMVGIGAAMPTYRDAQQASPLFIITSILPVYFAMVLIAEPSGLIARITSYFPFMSPLVLTFRASINALPVWEQLLGIAVTLVYVALGLYLAFKLFEIGSLETGRKVSLKSAFKKQ
jgi:ABC-2 type transport system permease protein